MRKTAILVSICLMPSAASAVDWSLRSTLSETVDLSDNLFLKSALAGGAYASYSTVTANAQARTETSKFDFDSDVSYRKYFGPDASGLPQTENLAYGFTGHYETFGKYSPDRNFIDASFRQSSAAFALLSDLGLLSRVSGAIDKFQVSGGLDRSLNARDTISLTAHATETAYEPAQAGTAFLDTSADVTWRHRLDAITTLSASTQAEWLSFDNAFGTNVLILRNQLGIETSLSPLLSFRGTAGAAYVQTDHGTATLTSIAGTASTPGAASSSDIGFITDMLLTYKAFKSTTFTLEGSQSTGPTAVGSLLTRATIQAGATHLINAVSSLSFSASINRQTSSSTSDFASASLNYSYQFTREWSAQLTYIYQHRFGSSGTTVFDPITGTPIASGNAAASSNSVLVVVSKSFLVLPHSD